MKRFSMPEMSGKNGNHCVVWGGYGGGNTGDDLTLAITLHDLRGEYGDSLTVLTQDPVHTRRAQPRETIVDAPRHDPHRTMERWAWKMAYHASSMGTEPLRARLDRFARSLQRKEDAGQQGHTALAHASRLHLVGGGYLTDLFNLDYMLRPVRFARAMGLAITTSPLGIGPFTNPRSARAAVQALRGARIRVRDPVSLQFCHLHQLEAEQHPDDGFRLREVLPLVGADDERRETRRRIGVCIFHQYQDPGPEGTEKWWEECLRTMSQNDPECRIEGFCFHTDESMDYRTTRRLFKRAGLNPDDVHAPEPDYRRAIMHLRSFDGIVSTRFHAVVAASIMHLPCVAAGVNEYYAIKMRCALEHSIAPALQVVPDRDRPQAPWQFLSRHMRPPAHA